MLILVDTSLKKGGGCWSHILGEIVHPLFPCWRLTKIVCAVDALRDAIVKEPCLILSHCFSSDGIDRISDDRILKFYRTLVSRCSEFA